MYLCNRNEKYRSKDGGIYRPIPTTLPPRETKSAISDFALPSFTSRMLISTLSPRAMFISVMVVTSCCQ